MKYFERRSLAEQLFLDIPLCFGLLVLCGLGLVILYSASGEDIAAVIRQTTHMIIAWALMILVARLSPADLERWSLCFFIGGVIALILVLGVGEIGKGAKRWLDLGIVRFQPSELMKLAVPMVVTRYVVKKSLPPSIGDLAVIGVLIMIPVILIARQPDLGTAFIVAATGLLVPFLAGMHWRQIMLSVVLGGLYAPIHWHFFMHDYQKSRILTLFSPEQQPLDAGYHIIQSKIATGSGGLYGKGWLNGTQSHLEFLPERSTDFIFAVYAEEFGLMGVLLLLSVYLFIIGRGLYIAVNAQHAYGKLLAATLALTFLMYTFINMSMAVGQLPVVGVPLPLISYGGTSMVTLMMAFGILMSIHTHRRLYP